MYIVQLQWKTGIHLKTSIYVSFFVTKVLLVAGGRTGRRMDKDSNTAGYLSSTELYSKQTGKWTTLYGELDTY